MDAIREQQLRKTELISTPCVMTANKLMSRATKASKEDGEKAKEPDCVCDLCDAIIQ